MDALISSLRCFGGQLCSTVKTATVRPYSLWETVRPYSLGDRDMNKLESPQYSVLEQRQDTAGLEQ